MSWWSEGKLKKDKEKEKSDLGLDRIHAGHRKANKRYCPKAKDHKHVMERILFPNRKHPYFSSEWKKDGWFSRGGESRWFMDKCSLCGREETIHERRDIVTRVRVILCENKQQCKFYLEQFVSRPSNEGKNYHVSLHFLEAANDVERVMFRTPDDMLLGLRIERFDLAGTIYKHPKYVEAIEILKSSIIND